MANRSFHRERIVPQPFANSNSAAFCGTGILPVRFVNQCTIFGGQTEMSVLPEIPSQDAQDITVCQSCC